MFKLGSEQLSGLPVEIGFIEGNSFSRFRFSSFEIVLVYASFGSFESFDGQFRHAVGRFGEEFGRLSTEVC